MRPISKHAKIFATTIFVILLLDIVAGAIFIPKKVLNIRKFHPYYHHGLKKNEHSIENWTLTKKYELFTNSLGLRDVSTRDVKLQTDDQTERIVFIGDSFTEGVGIPYDQTFVGLVGKKLKNNNTEVLNAAVTSYSAFTYYLKIRYLIENEGLKFNKLYVFYDLSDPYNDYMLETEDHFTPQYKEPLFTRLKRETWSFVIKHSSIMHSFDIIFPYVKYRKFEKGFAWWTLREEVYDDWASKGLDISALYMQRLVDLCKKNNIKITIAVYPWTNLIMERDLHSKMVVFWADFTKKNNIAFLNYFPDFINDQATSAQVIDKYFLPDDIHWNEQGHELIANEIIKYSNLNNK